MHECMKRPHQTLMPEADWRLVRAFVAVMRTGNLTRAAAALRTTQPTVGRQIRILEDLAGETYFLRQGNRLVPTERARMVYERAIQVEEAVTGLARELASPPNDERKTVRITTSPMFGAELMPSLLPELMAKVPEADFEVIATDEVENLMRRDADIAIRFVQPTQGDLVALPVAKVAIGLYASRDYIARRGRVENPADLVDHIFISNRSGDDVRQGAAALGLDPEAMRLFARSDLAVFRNSAVVAGIGICACHTWWADLRPDLERVLPGIDVATLPLWLVAHEDMRRSLTQRNVFAILRIALKERFLTGHAAQRMGGVPKSTLLS